MTDRRDPMLLLAPSELAPDKRVWGTGGWLPPEEREALDWLTLARLCGWTVAVRRRAQADASGAGAGRLWVVLAGAPDDVDDEQSAWLAARLAAEPLLVVARAASAGRPVARLAGVARRPDRVGGRSLRWVGPGRERRWSCRRPHRSSALELAADAEAWATLDGAPAIVARRVGRGTVATLGFHPSEGRDRGGEVTSLLRHLLIWGTDAPVAWHDLEGSLALRMDDPGGAQNVHLRSWSYAKLGEGAWAAVGQELRRRRGRLSIGYVSGWVDDGDSVRGTLEVAGQPVEREAGSVHPSPLVRYRDRAGLAPGAVHDYQAEYRGIQELRAAGLADVELHGYTHMHANPAAWAKAPDRYDETCWYRELGRASEPIIAGLPPDRRPLALGMGVIRRYFGTLPTTVIFPGDEFTEPAVERALDLGLRLVSSYYHAIRHGERFCWTQHVCAPYLDEPDRSWFDAGLPVVGYFHDRDVAVNGVDWLGGCLDRWRVAGAQRVLDLREVAAATGRCLSLDADDDGVVRLTVVDEGAPALVRPHPVKMRWPGRRWPTRIVAATGGRPCSLEIESLADGLARAMLPGPRERGPAGDTAAAGSGQERDEPTRPA